MTCKKFLVSGVVQGVFYRASAAKQANNLGLTGWVRNLEDGRVEAKICGDEITIAEMERWLWLGSAGSRVKEVISYDDSDETFPDFKVR